MFIDEARELYAEALDDIFSDVAPDLHILKTIVEPHYSPRDKPLTMSVGPGGAEEATLLRVFHRELYNVPEEKTRVAGLNIRNLLGAGGEDTSYRDDPLRPCFVDSFDLLRLGPMSGDAAIEMNWMGALVDMAPDSESASFDLSYIRNPDFVRMVNYRSVFATAVERTHKDGVVVAVIRETDVKSYETLLEMLEGQGISPIFSGKTDLELDRDDRSHFHHTVGIFKGRSNL